jgi:competence protein ComEA
LRKIKKLFIWIAIACIAATVYAITANLGGPITVDVAGAVASPAVYELERGSRIHEAIEAAGGFTEEAETGYLNRAAVLHDGDKLYVPTKEANKPEAEPPDAMESPPDSAESSGSGVSQLDTEVTPPDAEGVSSGATESIGDAPDASVTSDAQPININTANAEALQTLKDIGPVTAQKIIDHRNKNGPFKKIEDIKKVEGIGEKTFEKLKNHIRVQ